MLTEIQRVLKMFLESVVRYSCNVVFLYRLFNIGVYGERTCSPGPPKMQILNNLLEMGSTRRDKFNEGLSMIPGSVV